jgi:predicted nucleotidyltransferase
MSDIKTIAPSFSSFQSANSCSFPRIAGAITQTQDRQEVVEKTLSNAKLIDSTETSVVVFGSLARNEVTPGSDIDWTLLVDGPADPLHRDAAHQIAKRLKDAGFKGPGPAGIFGSIAFSHSIIHQIGGEEDTNRNTTQRILLLLESKAIGSNEAYSRVLNSIITRYFSDDMVFATGKMKKQRVPRFLLNDIIRYWRTVAVDYASKKWERNNSGWALRNIKLRMSRKLTFCAGLLACFNCELDDSVQLDPEKFGTDGFILPLVNRTRAFVCQPPLEILVRSMVSYGLSVETIKKALGAYDAFLGILIDEGKRAHLEDLKIDDSQGDKIFNEAREVSYDFQAALDILFFENQRLGPLTKKYGVF